MPKGSGGSRGSSSSSGLHYTKSGSLDMRYSSSKAACSQSSFHSPQASDLHLKKDGTLDMRYSSSKESTSFPSELHVKKDGTLDMRYSSSKAIANNTSSHSSKTPKIHHKKDGTLDMRYTTSKLVAEMGKLNSKPHNVAAISANIPLTKKGLPDMRTKQAKDWVEKQAYCCKDVPNWIPLKKDKTPDFSKVVTLIFFKTRPCTDIFPTNARVVYYENRLKNEEYLKAMQHQRESIVQSPRIVHPISCSMIIDDEHSQSDNNSQIILDEDIKSYTKTIESTQDSVDSSICHSNDESNNDWINLSTMDSTVSEFQAVDEYKLDESRVDSKDRVEIGRGGFGVVYKVKLDGNIIAMKELHNQLLTKKEKKDFLKEIAIMIKLGDHENIIKFHGFLMNPMSLLMEYAALGSLNYLLHYCDLINIEVFMTDGRIKKKLAMGLANGMWQLHTIGVIHGDLKPQNILVTHDYVAKITDFGLSTLRAKTSSISASTAMEIEDDYAEGGVLGTAGYMAPELLDGDKFANEATDVYSFGILLNELIEEEEPYYLQLPQFHGKGIMAAALYAKDGNRPRCESTNNHVSLQRLIQRCWSANAIERPMFPSIIKELNDLHIPHSCVVL